MQSFRESSADPVAIRSMFFVEVLVALVAEPPAIPPPELDPMPLELDPIPDELDPMSDELGEAFLSSLAQLAVKRPQTAMIPIMFTDRVRIMNSSM
ncbi:MAG TPA: hypothetical protein VJ746_17625 [Nitrospira sp.]|nr:hypothetical protein [Nitrospira sp.]